VVERSFKSFGIHEGAAGGWLLALYLYVRTLHVAICTSFSQVKIVSNNSISSNSEVFIEKTTF
jgi:hypothetical protein